MGSASPTLDISTTRRVQSNKPSRNPLVPTTTVKVQQRIPLYIAEIHMVPSNSWLFLADEEPLM